MIVLVMGTLMYVVEGPREWFSNIPTAVYWAITTMTTVGFGDITPKTDLGRLIASVAMLLGCQARWPFPTGIVTAEMTAQRRHPPPTTRTCHECLVKATCSRPGSATNAVRALRRTRPDHRPETRHEHANPIAVWQRCRLGLLPRRLRHLVDVLQDEVGRGRLPGAVALVARHGQILLFETVGQQDPAQGWPMAQDAIFRIYSMTKPVVSVAVMMLVEQGGCCSATPWPSTCQNSPMRRLRVTSMVIPCCTARGAPTVHDLLRHTAGLTYEILGTEPIQRQYAQARLASRSRTNREFAQTLAALP